MKNGHRPMPLRQAPAPIDAEMQPLLREPFASVWVGDARPALAAALRSRLLDRVAGARARGQGMVTARWSRLPVAELASGVLARTLYMAAAGRPARAGEPARVRLIDMQPGSRWAGPEPDAQREWLVVQGAVNLGGTRLCLRDYQLAPAGSARQVLQSESGARVFLREAGTSTACADKTVTVFDGAAGWPDFVPGIQRRVLWQHAGQAAMLYYAQPGAAVPLHSHGHDEECLMVQGELFLDDVLLQCGDYQLAPAGTRHRCTETDTGAVIYAHGDLDLQFIAAG